MVYKLNNSERSPIWVALFIALGGSFYIDAIFNYKSILIFFALVLMSNFAFRKFRSTEIKIFTIVVLYFLIQYFQINMEGKGYLQKPFLAEWVLILVQASIFLIYSSRINYLKIIHYKADLIVFLIIFLNIIGFLAGLGIVVEPVLLAIVLPLYFMNGRHFKGGLYYTISILLVGAVGWRSGVVVLIASFIISIYFSKKNSKISTVVLTIAAISTALLYVFFELWNLIYLGLGDISSGRILTWYKSIFLILDDSYGAQLLGHPIGSYPYNFFNTDLSVTGDVLLKNIEEPLNINDSRFHPHNSFIYLIYSFGYIGFILLSMFFLKILCILPDYKYRKYCSNISVSLSLGGATSGILHFDRPYIWLILGVILNCIRYRDDVSKLH